MAYFAWVLMWTAAAGGAAPEQPAGSIEVSATLIKLIEQVDVPAQEAGVLVAVNVAEGQMVAEGDLLAQIADDEARIAEDQAKIEIEIARRKAENDINVRFVKKAVEVAKAELQRSLDSVAKYPKSISDTEMDRLRLLVQKATLEVEQAEHEFAIAGFARRLRESEYQAAQQKVKQFKIMAHLGGVVVQVNRHRGEWVKPGETVMRILRLDRLRAEGFLQAHYLSADLQGRPVKLAVELPGNPVAEFPGSVVFLDPEIDPVNAQIRIWAEVQNKGLRLRPGMRAKMTIAAPR